jgi:MFS transporter, PAT family, beta-lactamase induction signal transducer AmpG
VVDERESQAAPPLAPPWWALLTLPFGLATGYANVTVPYLLRARGVSMVLVATVTQVAALPHVVKLLWSPALDAGAPRRTWFFGAVFATAACLAAAGFVPPSLTEHAGPVALLWVFTAVLLASQAAVATSSTAVLAMMAVTVPVERRGATSGWQTAGNLGGMAAGGALLVWMNDHASARITGLTVALLCAASAAPALFVHEAPLPRRSIRRLVAELLRDVAAALKAREGWTGLLICLSPVGAGALTNLFGALARDYARDEASAEHLVLFVTGLLGGVVNAGGALIGGYVADRINRRVAYVAFGGLTALSAIGMALAAPSPRSFAVGCLAYQLANGMSYAAFYAFVLDLLGRRQGVTTQLALFAGAANLAGMYVTWFDGWAYDLARARLPRIAAAGADGMLFADALASFAGIGALGVILWGLRRRAEPASVGP